jgi:hypothetical protein
MSRALFWNIQRPFCGKGVNDMSNPLSRHQYHIHPFLVRRIGTSLLDKTPRHENDFQKIPDLMACFAFRM